MTAGRNSISNNKHWNTPPKIAEKVEEYFNYFKGGIDLDPCSNEASIVNAHTKLIYPFQDGLKYDWSNHNTIS